MTIKEPSAAEIAGAAASDRALGLWRDAHMWRDGGLEDAGLLLIALGTRLLHDDPLYAADLESWCKAAIEAGELLAQPDGLLEEQEINDVSVARDRINEAVGLLPERFQDITRQLCYVASLLQPGRGEGERPMPRKVRTEGSQLPPVFSPVLGERYPRDAIVVGDEVRIVVEHPPAPFTKGSLGLVVAIISDHVRVRLKDSVNLFTHSFRVDEIERIPPAADLRPGNWVKTRKAIGSFDVGSRGHIESIEGDRAIVRMTRERPDDITKRDIYTYGFYLSELEPAA